MEHNKLTNIINHFESALKKVALNSSNINIVKCEAQSFKNDQRFIAVFGIVGMDIGRIVFEIDQDLATAIAAGMSGEPIEDLKETYAYIAEFANMVSGNSIITMNNSFISDKSKLTPPALFYGNNIELLLIKTISLSNFYKADQGFLRLEIGFMEGGGGNGTSRSVY